LAVDLDHNFDDEKKRFFRPGVLSRICGLGPCVDLRGCEVVPIWPLRGR
jgi:hypothetical protein